MNQNDCKACEGWGCSRCQPRRVGEQADIDLVESDKRVAAEREACAKLAMAHECDRRCSSSDCVNTIAADILARGGA